MRRLLLLAVFALAACDPPLQELFPPRYYVFQRAGIDYDLRAQYDPFVLSWFVEASSIERPMSPDDIDLALSLAQQDLGAVVCDGHMLDVDPGELWNPLAGDRAMYLADIGTWRFVGRCTDVPVAVAPVATDNPWLAVTTGADTAVIVVPEETD